MKVSGLKVRVSQRERCPYCHELLAGLQQASCNSCRTPHHLACLSELGACTVLGCDKSVFRRPLRARLIPTEDEERHECYECFTELLVDDCPWCGDPLLGTCDGSGRHCQNSKCWPFYDVMFKLADDIDDPKTLPWGQRRRLVFGYPMTNETYLMVALCLLALLTMLGYLWTFQ